MYTVFSAIKYILKSSNPLDKQLFEKIPKKILDQGKELDCLEWILDYKEKYKDYPIYELVEKEFSDELALVKYNPSIQPDYILEQFLKNRKKAVIGNKWDEIYRLWDSTGIPPNFNDFTIESNEIISYGLTKTVNNKNISLETLKPSGGVFLTGINSFDEKVGGLQAGEMVCFAARPNVGKSIFLMWLAGYLWYNRKNKVLFVTCELASQNIMQRFVAINGDFNPNLFRQYDDPTKVGDSEKRVIDSTIMSLNTDEDKSFIVPDKLCSSMYEVGSLIIENKPDIVVIDAFYMLSSGVVGDQISNVKSVLDYLKQLSITYQVPIVITSQFNRNSKGNDFDLRDLAFSDYISMITDYIFAIGETDNLEQRVLNLIKTRAGYKGLVIPFELNLENLRFNEIEI